MIRRALIPLLFAVGVAGVAGCGDPPPFALRFALTQDDGYACTSDTGQRATVCSDVTLACDAVLSIRIFAPGDPSAPYIKVCRALPASKVKDLCSIAGIDLPLPSKPVPLQTLEVQMALYPKTAIKLDPDTGELDCPSDLKFSSQGFPLTALEPCTDTDPTICPPDPAIGGRTFYHPEDSVTVVSLGCTNPAELQDPTCAGTNSVTVTATVNDFDNPLVPISKTLGDQLLVSVGEPTLLGSEYVLYGTAEHLLDRTVLQPPAWDAAVDEMFVQSACLAVLEDGAQTTTSLTCRTATSDLKRLDFTGIRLAKSTLQDVLAAVGLPTFPDKGLTIGMVLDSNGIPAANVALAPTAGTVLYLSADRHSLVTGATSASGIFVSRDAPFGTTFPSKSQTPDAIVGYGGLVSGKVTIVITQLAKPGTGG